MTREQSWQVDAPTAAMLHQLTALGYCISVHHLRGSLLSIYPPAVEMHAVHPDRSEQQFGVRVGLGESGGNEPYHCAELLAERVRLWQEE